MNNYYLEYFFSAVNIVLICIQTDFYGFMPGSDLETEILTKWEEICFYRIA